MVPATKRMTPIANSLSPRAIWDSYRTCDDFVVVIFPAVYKSPKASQIMTFATRTFQIACIAALVALLVAAGVQSCSGGSSGRSESRPGETASETDPARPSGAMNKIVAVDQEGFFEDEKGNRFIPWGFNYTNTPALGLIDDNIHSDNAWHIIEGDFAEMRGLTANAVRIHLQYNRFMLDPRTIDPRAFDALERIVNIAEENHLYLIITGLGAYRKEDSPVWYDSLSVKERWDTHALFWKTVASRVGNRKAVFAYDLMNEPVVSVCNDSASCDWLVGEPFGGFHFVQNISLEPERDPDETIAAWIGKLTEAIRSEDSRTFITIGSLPKRPLAFFADNLDFVSPHIYPNQENSEALIEYVLSAPNNQPLVLGEFFNLQCSPGELDEFLLAIKGRYHGLFGHYGGRTPIELLDEGDTEALTQCDFLLFFVEKNPNRHQVPLVQR